MKSLCLARDDVYHPVSQECPVISPPSFPCGSESLIQIDHGHSLTKQSYVSPFRWTKGNLSKSRQSRVTIDVLPDDVLLKIFDCYCYIDEDEDEDPDVNAWHALVHVSRNWRCVVLDSPRRLNLRLLCSERTPVREMLVIWPPLPIIIRLDHSTGNENGDNIIAALGHHDRVCDIHLHLHDIPSSLLEKTLVAMQGAFPALETLDFRTRSDMAPVVPDSFLGGSGPHLRNLTLEGIPFPFPGLRKLLLSATDLVQLSLFDIPHSGYFSPEAIVTCLSALTRLEKVLIGFESPRSRPSQENRRPPPPTRTLLPALRSLIFGGASEYLEVLVARIDAPLLDELYMRFFHQLIFDTPQLAQFISSTQGDEVPKEAHAVFFVENVSFTLPGLFADELELVISCGQLDWQVSALEQVCRSSFPQALIPTVEHLIIDDRYWVPQLQLQLHDDMHMDNSQWLELLHPFIGVKNLFLSFGLAPLIALALQELVGERANDVLPALQSINLGGLDSLGGFPEGIRHFVDARHLSSHPIAIVPWNRAKRVVEG